MCLPTALALPLHSSGTSAPPVIDSSARCYKSAATIKSIEASFANAVSRPKFFGLTSKEPYEIPDSL
jgi:hypothetical protein